ncbi:histone-lysine N-methyltransferase, H3 lysine-79 specific [Bombus impatiens]|uniref:Histone-lysine N-methyltransferase, H3 lysine-79 specific n=1 Tax=Bombus impatiens TaxID=132113 RepID=A0A6P8LDQ0_BOMIM|nr:histone-lysine N-methyltransferase, H3 lysine-79 specific [Bombus impatiens]
MIGRTSLVEQKRIQWAREREEMARLGGSWGLLKNNINIRTNIRTYPNGARMSLTVTKDKQSPSKPFRAAGHYGSTVSLKSLVTESSGNGGTSVKCLDCNGGSLINLHEQSEVSQIRHRSPSLPPIYNKDQQQYHCQGQQRDFATEGLHYHSEKRRLYDRYENSKNNHYGSQGEEREGETSGYASDSVDVPVSAKGTLLPSCKPLGADMTEKTWQNPYHTTPENSLPPSRRLSDGRIGELNRPRWGSVWGQETTRGDPPPPSWLSRLGHSSQVLVINHESASSSDSSTVGSIGSDNKTYLRGQNIPVDAQILQEREVRRQKALELQSAIKKQLEEKDRQRKEEKERRLREERLEEERIKREREKEKERFEEEQRKLKDREAAKLRQAEAMREVLEAAERLAKEQKKFRRKCEKNSEENPIASLKNCESNISNENQVGQNCASAGSQQNLPSNNDDVENKTVEKETSNTGEYNNVDNNSNKTHNDNTDDNNTMNKSEQNMDDIKPVQVPVSKDVAIVLSGRLEDSELLSKANLQLVNLVLTPTPRRLENNSNSNLSVGLNTFIQNIGSSNFTPNSSRISSMIVENRLLTPSKYRAINGRDFGTQTDIEKNVQDFPEKVQDLTTKDTSMKDRKDATNAIKRDIEKSANVGLAEDIIVKTFRRSKPQPRRAIESRPQWNANRPGTRYRTQSEKDPHYQRRLRLRRRQVESSDERSRSPSPDRRKFMNIKSKIRTLNRSKLKVDNYDADLSMDSLNSIIPLRTDKNGRITIEENRNEQSDKARLSNVHINNTDNKGSRNDNSNIWCGQEILSKLSTLKNGLLMKQIEWDSERCLISPVASEIF